MFANLPWRMEPGLWLSDIHHSGHSFAIKHSQANVEVQADAADREDQPLPQKRKWRQLEARIQLLKRQYEAGDRTLTEYWKAVPHCIADFQ